MDKKKIRMELVRAARGRVRSGYYNDPAVLTATVSKMLQSFRQGKRRPERRDA